MPITKYPDEPHPENSFEWKRWYVNKTHQPDQPVDLEWLDDCYLTTLSAWGTGNPEDIEDTTYDD